MGESIVEMVDRLQLMSGRSAIWDLSVNDQRAIRYALDRIAALECELIAANASDDRGERDLNARVFVLETALREIIAGDSDASHEDGDEPRWVRIAREALG